MINRRDILKSMGIFPIFPVVFMSQATTTVKNTKPKKYELKFDYSWFVSLKNYKDGITKDMDRNRFEVTAFHRQPSDSHNDNTMWTETEFIWGCNFVHSEFKYVRYIIKWFSMNEAKWAKSLAPDTLGDVESDRWPRDKVYCEETGFTLHVPVCSLLNDKIRLRLDHSDVRHFKLSDRTVYENHETPRPQCRKSCRSAIRQTVCSRVQPHGLY